MSQLSIGLPLDFVLNHTGQIRNGDAFFNFFFIFFLVVKSAYFDFFVYNEFIQQIFC